MGEFVADIIVNDTVILELKSVRQRFSRGAKIGVRRIIQVHEVQLMDYIVATGKPVGLILNLGERKVDVKRKIKDLNE